ncbi:MAG: PEGA domain-containing protein [Pirellulaceae bacterium]
MPRCHLASYLLLATALFAVFHTGCVQRRILVRSNPEGALVSIDRQPIGHTPVAVPFTYYGTREIHVEKDGYQTQHVKHRFKAPWYQIPPLDFITDNFWPREIRDDRMVNFDLTPQVAVDENFLLDRANQLRGNASRGTIAMPLAHQRPDDTPVDSEPQQTAILPGTVLNRNSR